MKNNSNKIIIISLGVFFAIIGFMVKLPAVFHRIDKELHALFYFGSYLLATVLLPKKRNIISLILLLFGLLIEFGQHMSNSIAIKINKKRIHGNFDIEDIQFNTIGIIAGYIVLKIIRYFTHKKRSENGNT